MHKIRVAVLRGGPSAQFESSRKNGEVVLKYLPEHGYEAQDIFISKDGEWHKNGFVITPHNALSHVDVVWNALQGMHDENRKIHHILEMHKIPFTGAGAFAAGITVNPLLLREILRHEKIRIPQYVVIDIPPQEMPADEIASLWRTFAPPVYLRPVSKEGGSVVLVKTFKSFTEALEAAFETADSVIMEEYFPGKQVTVGVIDEYRGIERYSLPVMERDFKHEEKLELEKLARNIHDLLGLRHYSQIDFLAAPRRGMYVTGITPSPDFHEESHFHKALHAVGAPVSHFIDHVVQLALSRK